MADDKMKAGDDPSDFTVDQVNDFLAGADDAEKARVLEAEASEDGKGRVGITEGPAAKEDESEEGDDSEDGDEEQGENEGLRDITSADLNPLYG